jgi:hypothetical protein
MQLGMPAKGCCQGMLPSLGIADTRQRSRIVTNVLPVLLQPAGIYPAMESNVGLAAKRTSDPGSNRRVLEWAAELPLSSSVAPRKTEVTPARRLRPSHLHVARVQFFQLEMNSLLN